jgi:hypothetical protein
MLLGLAAPLHAQRPSEYAVKAAFLFNFAKFVEWPPSAFADSTSPFVLCVLGPAPFGETFAAIEGQTVQGRRLRVERHQRPDEPGTCHILFVSSALGSEVPQILRRVGSAGILTVGEQDDFTRLGGMINFVIRDNRVQFEVNPAAAERVGLKPSSRLLRLAIPVGPRPAEGVR